jgi:hypothetical protein
MVRRLKDAAHQMGIIHLHEIIISLALISFFRMASQLLLHPVYAHSSYPLLSIVEDCYVHLMAVLSRDVLSMCQQACWPPTLSMEPDPRSY